jgi:ankyrin repeat protein
MGDYRVYTTASDPSSFGVLPPVVASCKRNFFPLKTMALIPFSIFLALTVCSRPTQGSQLASDVKAGESVETATNGALPSVSSLEFSSKKRVMRPMLREGWSGNFLIERPAGPGRTTYSTFDMTAMRAVTTGSTNDLIKGLESGFEVNSPIGSGSWHGMTLLHLAVDLEDIPIVKLLLARKANPNAQMSGADRSGITPLHVAVYHGSSDIARMLLDAGANIEAADGKGKFEGLTALHQAAMWGDIPMLQTLLARKPNINVTCAAGETPGLTALHWAAIVGSGDVGSLLLKSGADPKFAPNEGAYAGFTSLHAAAQGGCVQLVQQLLSLGMNPNALWLGNDQRNVTPLYLAAGHGHREIVELLVKNGAKVDAVSGDGQTPLFQAIAGGNLEVVKSLLSAKAAINRRDKAYGWTPLHFAAKGGNSEIVAQLIRAGADVNDKVPDGKFAGYTPLHAASATLRPSSAMKDKANAETIVTLLIGAKADVNAKVTSEQFAGFTPLHSFSVTGPIGAVKALVQAAADVNAVLQGQYTPLDNAILNHQNEIAEYLESVGANRMSTRSRTP